MFLGVGGRSNEQQRNGGATSESRLNSRGDDVCNELVFRELFTVHCHGVTSCCNIEQARAGESSVVGTVCDMSYSVLNSHDLFRSTVKDAHWKRTSTLRLPPPSPSPYRDDSLDESYLSSIARRSLLTGILVHHHCQPNCTSALHSQFDCRTLSDHRNHQLCC